MFRCIFRRVFLSLVVCLTVLMPTVASACMCMSAASPDELIADVSIVFAGTLQRTDKCTGEGAFHECYVGIFSVSEAFKGKLGDTVALRFQRQDGLNCGAVFRPAASHLVAARGSAKDG